MWVNKNECDVRIPKQDYEASLGKNGQKKIRTYQSKDIQKIARITDNQLKHWTMVGVITPHKTVRGTGKSHVYDHQNLIEVMICRELSEYSINYTVMRDVIGCLRIKKLCFHITDNKEKTESSVIKEHTVWSYLMTYFRKGNVSLTLWKDQYLPKTSEPETDDHCIDLIINNMPKIRANSKSMIIVSLDRLLDEAGSFYEEEQ